MSQPAPARRSFSFSLRTLFVVVTVFAGSSARTRPDRDRSHLRPVGHYNPVMAERRKLGLNFSLRTALFLMTLCALVLAAGRWFWVTEVAPYAAQQRGIEELSKLGARIVTRPGGRDWVRDRFGKDRFRDVVSVQLSGTQFHDEHLKLMESFINLQSLKIYNTNMTGCGLQDIDQLRQLRALRIANALLSDEFLAYVASHVELEDLWINSTEITDAGLPILARLRNLRTIFIGSGIGEITRDKRRELLRALPLLDSRVIISDERSIAAQLDQWKAYWSATAGRITTISFEGTRVGDEGLQLIRPLTSLNHLRLCGNPVTDIGLQNLAGFDELQLLDLGRGQITRDGLNHLRALGNLERLFINSPVMGDDDLEPLADLRNLVELRVRLASFRGDGLRHLYHLEALRTLDLRVAQLNDAAVDELCVALPELNCVCLKARPDDEWRIPGSW